MSNHEHEKAQVKAEAVAQRQWDVQFLCAYLTFDVYIVELARQVGVDCYCTFVYPPLSHATVNV